MMDKRKDCTDILKVLASICNNKEAENKNKGKIPD